MILVSIPAPTHGTKLKQEACQMSLSDNERARLKELEQYWAAEDPNLAQRLQATSSGHHMLRVPGGLLVIVFGLVIVVTAINLDLVPLGVAGFLIMITGSMTATGPSGPMGQMLSNWVSSWPLRSQRFPPRSSTSP